MKYKFLVTGGAGFIGSSLAARFKELGAEAVVFDIEQGNDINDHQKLKETVKKKFDAIYHLAGFSGPSVTNKNILKSFQVNTLATASLCELIVKYSPQTKLILSSSRLEYGKPQYLPVDENHPTNPTSAYGLSKLAATQMALIYHQKNSLDVTIFRTSNVYGPHKTNQATGYNIINNFIDQALKGGDLTIYGDGSQKRDYIYIDDLIRAFILALEKTKISSGQIYNLGYGKGIKFKEMVSLIAGKVGEGKIKHVPWPRAYEAVETGSYVSDISKIKKQLGFVPKIDFKKGIAKTIAKTK